MVPIFIPLFSNITIATLCIVPLLMIIFDIITGLARAIKTKEFKLRRIADFLGTSFLKYLACFGAVLLTWIASDSTEATIVAGSLGMGTLTVAIAGSISENLDTLGLPPAVVNQVDGALKEAEHIETKGDTFAVTDEMPAVRAARIKASLPTEKIPVFEVPDESTPIRLPKVPTPYWRPV